MNILVIGAHFYNKGAHLMMKTVSEKFKEKKNVRLFLSPCTGNAEQIESVGYARLDFPLKHVTAYRSFDVFYWFGWAIRFLDKKYRGELKPSKIDAVLDISGFAYSDQWGQGSVVNLNKVIKKFKRNGTKFIFLPQAFGPFTSTKIKNEMVKAVKSADLVAVRDKDSKRMIDEVFKDSKVVLYPDITLGLKPEHELKLDNSKERYACIVPNERMLDQGREYWPEGKYMEYVKRALEGVLEMTDLKVYIVVHDNGKGDEDVAQELIKNYIDNPRVIKYFEYDPLLLKGFLGKAQMVVGSRFHALVSALSQNVPCLSLGWSHKYKMLFDEYKIGHLSFDKPNDKTYQERLRYFLDENNRGIIEEEIEVCNIELKRKNDEMWNRIFNILEI